MATLRNIMTRFGFKVDEGKLKSTNQKIGETKKRLAYAAREARKASASINTMATAVKVGLAGALAQVGVRGLITDFVESGDAAAKSAAAMGITTTSYQRLKHAAELSGSTIEDLQSSLGKLGKQAYQAAEGGKTQADAFRSVGVAVKDSSGNIKGQDVLLAELADRFAAMPDGTKKSALVMELFGRSGAKLVPLLNEGSAGIAAMGDEAERLGLVLSREDLTAAEDFDDAMGRLKGVVVGLRNRLALQLIPALTAVAQRTTAWFAAGDHARKVLETLRKAAKLALVALALFAAKKYQNGFWAVVDGLKKAKAAMQAFGTASLRASVKAMLLPAAFILLLLLLEDLAAFAQGKDSLIGRALGDSGAADELRSSLKAIGSTLKTVGQQIGKAMKVVGPGLLKALPAIATGIAYAVVGVVKFVELFVGGLAVIGQAIGIAAAQLYLWYLDAVEWTYDAIGSIVKAWNAAIDWIVALPGKIGDAFLVLGEWLVELWAGFVLFLSKVADKAVAIFDAIVAPFKKAFNKIDAAVRSVFGALLDFISGIGDEILGSIEAAIDGLREIIKAMPSIVQDALPKAVVDFAYSGVPEGPPAFAAGLVESAQLAVKGGQNGSTAPSINVGALSVNVAGSADMSAPAMQVAVREGALEAFGEMMRGAAGDLSGVW